MHFYMRNAKLDDIRKFQKERGLKSLGMPYMVGNGSVEINGIKHRFIVMPRYGADLTKHFLSNGRKLPEGTCYRLVLQMLEVYEFIHGCGYVHADLKAANMLLGYGPKQQHQAYLVDFGLASHYTTKDFKPDPKKMHNGTIEYTSRDAHMGVPTMRADLEILGYNLLEWLGIELPWVRDKLLTNPAKVQKAKEEFMSDVTSSLKKLFSKGVPDAVMEFMKYVAKLQYNDTPDYEKCRKMFHNALKVLKYPTSGDLELNLKSSAVASNNELPTTSKAKTTKLKGRKQAPIDVDDSEDEIIDASDDDDKDIIFEAKKSIKKEPKRILKTTNDKSTPKSTPKRNPRSTPRDTPKLSPVKLNSSLKRKSLNLSNSTSSPSPSKRTKLNGSVISPKNRSRRSPLKRSSPGNTSVASPRIRGTPVNAKANIRMSPAITMSSSRSGKTIINDRVTPNKKPSKTYEFNFELDVSMDANVIVNVKRKKKPLQLTQENTTSSRSTPSGKSSSSTTPVTKVNVRKVASDDMASPRTPAVTVKKSRRMHQSPS